MRPVVHVESVIEAIKSGHLQRSNATEPQPHEAQPMEEHRALKEVVASSLVRAGLDVSTVNELLQRKGTESKRLFDERQRRAGKMAKAEAGNQKRRLLDRQRTIGVADAGSPDVRPFAPTYMYLSRPFIIWQDWRPIEPPHLDPLEVDPHYEPLNSSVRFKVLRNQGSNTTILRFYYMWQNPNDFYALLNARADIELHGGVGVSAHQGLFSGAEAFASVQCRLEYWEWWNQPPTISPLPPAALEQVVSLYKSGGALFGGPETDSKLLSPPYPSALAQNLVAVPPLSTIIFDVNVTLSYRLTDAGHTADYIDIDFATDDYGYYIKSGGVLLEVLTPLQ